ncbi:Xanthine dehydrogenase/oxidase [Armadillidium vulgare]|nr:Xanthine dehydrogenase/oxidase [Armadillidium vulgare]
MTGSPISDLNPILMASGSKLAFSCVGNEREIDFDDQFFTGYRRNCTKENEVLKSIKIPLTYKNEHFFAYKQSRRRDDDIAIVNTGMKMKIKPQNGNFIVESLVMAFGGMAPTTIMAKKTMKKLTGMSLTEEMLDKALVSLLDELELDPSAPGGMTDYRKTLTASFFFKFYHSVRQELNESFPEYFDPSNELKESFKNFETLPTSSTQFFQNVPENQEKIDPVGRPIPHLSSLKQTSGEAEYVDDIPRFENELYAGLVMSTRAKAKIIKIDESEALAVEGVEAFVSAKDIPGTNRQGLDEESSEEIIASDQVHFVGQIIGVIVAQNQKLAQKAAKLVKISYQDLPDPIFTIEDAIAANSMWKPFATEIGDVDKSFEKADCILEGKTYLGGQEHFYMETNVHIAIPHEGKEIEIISSTQSPQVTQECVATALGIPSHFVTCKVRRIGGGFGGKETRTKMISTPLAIAATKVRRPLRIVLDRDEDMIITGGRHPFLGCWKVGFSKDGKVEALDIRLYSNAGYSLDLSGGVNARAVCSIDNVYKIENFKVYGYCCRTNLPSNTAFRGFGTPQGCFIMENIMARISEYTQIPPNTVRERNFYKDKGDITHYGQPLGDCQARRCWDQIISSSCYVERELEVKKFNRMNTYKKRGISAIPCKFAIAFGIPFLNQGGALVLIYKDGSALVSIGGTEMGQGLYTKIIQIVCRVLKIQTDKVYISETTTSTVPNASPTAASASSDIYGMAVLDACEKLLRRLKPIQEKHPESSWEDIIRTAYTESVSLFATGFHQMPDLQNYSLEKRKGAPFRYFTYGAAVSEVEIDCLTGDHVVLRTDIVMDVGNSLNPAIDIGQVEGAFIQGYGLFTLEQLVYSRSGALLTKGPGAYKIPSIMDIPRVFNVSLLRDSSNPKAIFSSKAVGEPPFFSGSSVFFALREAIKATSDSEEFRDGSFSLASPTTAEIIRMACKDKIIKLSGLPNLWFPKFGGEEGKKGKKKKARKKESL